ncbi:Crp/Fnr family transcriptional regulator [Paenibacillus ehimensis]|uniref:Crp/Fnr family transcriptional regulator n=1 Tax=Paenibacillus ehimensis TaxID=79264 RepID=A0ABT8VAH3_9BACL|nr:Crp/Fnr family transcriptional regulator [Paenibacillus ehimensis]MDO3677992.1 Crp/Fnr family transcriptional regulator [Paenibacillus ehimensis]MEC0210824.1 Crp/Fnr family transcriptional regulator [Paenibacillus ehimensis]
MGNANRTTPEAAHHIPQFLSDENMERLTQIMYPKQAAEGNYLFWEGDTADRLYYVHGGTVKLSKTTEDGKAFILQVAQPGDLFGEFGSGEPQSYGYDGIVMEDASLGVILLKDLEVLIWRHGDMALQLFKWMGQMQQFMQSKFRDLLLFGKNGALASTLIRLTNSYGEKDERGIRITIKLTHTDLANMIGSTREGVNRMLSEYKAAGAIELEGGRFVVTNLPFFQAMVRCAECPLGVCRI